MKPNTWILAAVGSMSLTGALVADWPQFRGPGGQGIAADKNLPTNWSASDNILWKTELPGPGSSSPIVVGKRIFVTCYSGYGLDTREPGDLEKLKRHLLCLDWAGKILWDRPVPAAQPEYPFSGFQSLHGYASSTPASDGKSVFVFFGKTGVLAFDLDGKQLWQSAVGTKTNSWGSAASPILYKDLLIVNASVESDSMVALKKSDGSPAWTAKGISLSWNTPVLVPLKEGGPELVVSTAHSLRGFDPAAGKELWHCGGIEDYVCPSVSVHDGVIFAIGGRGNTGLAVRAGGKGDVSNSHVVWQIKQGSNVSSPVYHDSHFYWGHESRGTVYCARASDGLLVYEERLTPASDRIYASPAVADGKIYYVSRTSGVYVVAAQSQYQLLAHNTLGDKSVFNASPAVSDGQLLLRSNQYLYCIGKKP